MERYHLIVWVDGGESFEVEPDKGSGAGQQAVKMATTAGAWRQLGGGSAEFYPPHRITKIEMIQIAEGKSESA